MDYHEGNSLGTCITRKDKGYENNKWIYLLSKRGEDRMKEERVKDFLSQYYLWEFNIIPLRNKSKIPAVPWKEFQVRKFPEKELKKYLGETENFAVVTGAISNNLVVLDFDIPNLFENFRTEYSSLVSSTLVVRTGRKGYHIYFRTPEPIHSYLGGKDRKIDIKGEGGYVVLPPAIHPDTGQRYEIVNNHPPLKLTMKEWKEIWTTLKKKDKDRKKKEKNDALVKLIEIIYPYWKEGQRDKVEYALLGYLRKKKVSKESAMTLIEKIVELTGDDEKSMRMAVLERTYNLPFNRLRGYTQLKDILQERDLWRLEKHVKALVKNDFSEKKNPMSKGEIKRVPYIALEDDLYLAVWDGKDNYKFAHLDRNGDIELLDIVKIEGVTYIPKEKGKIPIGYPSFDIVDAPSMTANEIMDLLKQHVSRYADMEENDLEMSIFYIMATWFYRKSNTVAYLRFLGDTGKGKSRMLKVIGDLCFYPLKLGGGASRSAIMRVQEQYHGTLILDESDFKGDKEDEMIKYINSGFERDNPFILTNKNTYQIEIFDAFSPKLFAMRHPFGDSATEGRLLSIEPYETFRIDIPAVLPLRYDDEVKVLRDILARFTLENWAKVKAENRELIQTLNIEPRVKQLATPLSIILPLFGEDMNNKFIAWLMKRQEEIAKHRANSDEGFLFNAIVDMIKGDVNGENLPEYVDYLENEVDGKRKFKVITTGMLREYVGFSPRKINKLLGELGFEVARRRVNINGEAKRPTVVQLQNTNRWVENWRRYRWGEEIMDVPEVIKASGRKYKKAMDLMNVMDAYQGVQSPLRKNRLNLLKKYSSGVCKDISPLCPMCPFQYPLVYEYPFHLNSDGKLEVTNIRGDEFSIEESSSSMLVKVLEHFKVELPRDLPNETFVLECSRGDIRILPIKVAKILESAGKVEIVGVK